MTSRSLARRGWRLASLAVAFGLAMPGVAAVSSHWQRLISQHDKTRLREWRNAWDQALTQARNGGFAAQIAAEGVLLQPDSALDRPDIPDGLYRCRLFKLGKAPISASPGFIAYPSARCRVGDGRLDVLEGEQRPGGRLFHYDDARLLLLGGMAVGDEQGTVRYGRDSQRDLLGLLDRVGPQRWRVAFPQPAWQSKLDVLELVPEPK